jgi:DNA-directed RNA polymerase subunit RPC12/RpoP
MSIEPEIHCPHCGSIAGLWFDRTISIDKDGYDYMPYRCVECGEIVENEEKDEKENNGSNIN